MNSAPLAVRRANERTQPKSGTTRLIVLGMGCAHGAGIVTASLKPFTSIVTMTISLFSVMGNSLLLKRAKLAVARDQAAGEPQ